MEDDDWLDGGEDRLDVALGGEISCVVCCARDLVLVYVSAHDVHREGGTLLCEQCLDDMVADESTASDHENFDVGHYEQTKLACLRANSWH